MAAKRILLVGASGPVGYDYRREEKDGVPYPVLEDLWGILLCYDEIWFLARELCPRDMWDLPYVRFIGEGGIPGADLSKLRLASEQMEAELGRDYAWVDPTPFGAVLERVTSNDANGLDNHSRGIRVDGDWGLMGNAGDLRLLVGDMGIAAGLAIPHLDVLSLDPPFLSGESSGAEI
jgi:hypothetical protein